MARHAATILLAAFVVAACASKTEREVGTTAEPVDTAAEELAPLPEWEVTIASREGFEVTGEATVRDLPEGQTRIAVEVRGADPGSTHPWHIHEGTCGSGGSVVGDATAYKPLDIGADGTASASAILNLSLDPDRHYSVNIHESPTEADKIVGCGELQGKQ